MKKSKRVISLLLSVFMLVSVFQTGFVAFAADGTDYVLSAEEAKKLPDAGAVTTSTQVVRVASSLYSYQTGTTIVPATPSGIPAMNGQYENNSLANVGNIEEEASYPMVKITFKELPTDVPQITCVNSKSAANNVVMSAAQYNANEKSYTWLVASGTANVGDTLQFKITYKYNDRTYVSNAYSYVESIAQPAGNYVTTESKYESGLFGWGANYYAGVSAATRILGINTYGSLASFTTSSSDLRGYYNASANSFVMRSSADYVTYGVSRSQSTRSDNNLLVYNINDRRSYADVYVDTSVTDSFADLNLRYAVAKAEKIGGNDTQLLNNVVAKKGYEEANSNLTGSGDYELGTVAATGVMGVANQYVTTFTGGKSTEAFVNGAEYTIVTKLSSEFSGAENETYFPVGLRIHTVDKGALRTLINDILHNYTPESPLTTANYKGVNPQSWYYSAGYSAYETAMLNAQTVLLNPRATQSQINGAITSLTEAYNGLVLAEADYSAATVAYNEALTYEETKDLYTDESYANLQKAISIYDADTNPDGTIQLGFSVLFQPQVDQWEKDIYSAIDALEYRRADYSELDAVYADAVEAEKIADKYLDFSSVKTAMNNINWDIKITEQEKVTAMTESLREALGNLKFRPADYTAVNDAVTRAQSYAASDYTSDSYANLRNLLRDIDYSLDVSKQDVVDNYVVQIEEAIANLRELSADYSKLEALLNQVNSLVEEHYYPETYKAAKDAAAACEGYDKIGITRQDEIDAMTVSVQAAVEGLVMYDADYSAIEDYIAEYNAMDLSQITKESIQAVEDAIAAVEYGLKIDRQSEVNNYALAISAAIKSLAYEPANYTMVMVAVERASTVDRTYWSVETLAALDAAVEAVQYGLGVNHQAEVDAMADKINDAIGNLQPGPADYSRVRTAIESFEALNPDHYTPTSIAAVRAVIDGINWNLTKAEQDKVNAYAFDITYAQIGLVKAKADYTELIAIQLTIPGNLESQYTEKSIDALNDVQNSINWNLFAEDQHIVVGYQNALTEAILNLKYLTGDYSDVDAAIAEGRAIIQRNDPPIAQDSIDAFEELVASIDRTYTIKQEAEIAALAVQIRAAYAQFGYAEAIHKASVELVADKSISFPGDIVTVSVIVGTDYYAAASSIPVLYDTNFYELVGTSVKDAFVFEGSYADASEKGGNINSPAKGYPSSYTADDKEQWKYALVTLGPSSDIREDAQILSPAQTVVKLQFRVLNNYTVGSYKAKIWIDNAFLKTETNKTGKLYIGRYETPEVSNNVVSVGQSIDLSKAALQLSVIDPNSPAVFTELQAAILRAPAYDASFYTPESYKEYADAVAAGEEIVKHTEYTVKEQPIIDAATKAINDAYAGLELLPANLKPLEDALALTPEYPADHYVPDTYSAFASAKATGQEILAESGLTIADDFRINAAAEAITKAFNALTIKPFSYTLLMNTWLDKELEYPVDYYTVDSYNAYSDAYETLLAFKASDPTFLNDEEGTNLIYALRDAYNALLLNDADTTPLENAINTPLEYDASFYTEETYAEYQKAVDEGNALLNSEERLTIADQERVQAAADAITNAAAALQFKPFSYQPQIDEALGTWFIEGDESQYTQESVDAFWNAYIELASFFGMDIRDDAEALRLLGNLRYALDNMKYLPADLTLLNEALALETLDEEYYDEITYQAYKDALAALEAYGEDKYWTLAEQDTVDELAQAIIDAHTALELKPFTKLADLEDAITAVPEYDSSYYQDEAYAEYEAARKVITDMIADAENLTILDDEAAVKAIEDYNTALEALKSAWADADYSDVEAAIAETEEYDRNIYTNFDIVDAAIEAVVYGLNILEQETVDGYAAAIREALTKLEASGGDYTPVEDAKKAAAERLAEMNATGIELDKDTVDALDAAIEAVVYGLDITKQDEIQGYADAIVEAIEALDYVSTIILKADSVAYITEEGYIRGLSEIWVEDEIIGQFDKYGKNTSIVVIPTMMGYGTGTIVQHFDGDELVKEYVIVVDGDANGDAFVDAIDVTIVANLINEFEEPENDYIMTAIDLEADGWLDAIDLTIIINMANMAF